nr:protein kinase [Gammaproteobacteria bacterium]
RFRREGQLVASLAHPNIVNVYQVGSTDRFFYIAMEYLGGGDLKLRIQNGMHRGEAIEVIESVAEALGYAHARNIVHRDVKPSNIIFRRDGVPLLSDFGIAKTTSDEVTDLTTIGMLLGSPTYMSPEQAEGRELDARTDLYSLGIILYELLTGLPPFLDPSALKVIVMHAQEPVPPLPEDVRMFQPLIDGLLEKDRDKRIQSAHDLLREIDALREAHGELLDGEPVYQPPDRAAGELTQLVDGMSAVIAMHIEQDRVMLPVGPAIVDKVERLCVGADVDRMASELEGLVSADPALAVQIVRVANSQYYRGERLVTDVPDALRCLGARAAEQVLAYVAATKLFYGRGTEQIRTIVDRVQRRAVFVAQLCQSLAEAQGLNSRLARLCGLIQNVGALPTLVWAQANPKLRGDEAMIESLIAKGQLASGVLLLGKWQFPDAVLGPLREVLHDLPQQHARETNLLKLANGVYEAHIQATAPTDGELSALVERSGCEIDGGTLRQIIDQVSRQCELPAAA